MEYAVVIEPTSTGFSAYVPDVPGCVAAGETEAEVTELIREALEFHLEALRLDGDPIPKPSSRLEYAESLPITPGQPRNQAEGRSGYVIVIEKGATSCGAYVPDLQGCVAAGDNEAEVRELIYKGIRLHLEAMQRSGKPIPEPASRIAYVDVAQTEWVA